MQKYEHKAGVYAIEHIATCRAYIGSTSNIPQRWTDHRRSLNKGRHSSPGLQAAWKEDGPEAFRFFVLEECAKDRVALVTLEQEYFDAFSPVFNQRKLATGSKLGSKTPSGITHCPAGHPYDEENTGYSTRNQRYCRKCASVRMAKKTAVETPNQTEARLAKMRASHIQHRDDRLVHMAEYVATHKEEKRAYDQARRDIKREQDRERRAKPATKAAANASQRKLRDNESPEHREQRLAQMREHAAEIRTQNREAKIAAGEFNKPAEACRRGHLWTPENTIQEAKRHLCRICRDERRAQETPEQKTERLAKRNEHERSTWQEMNRVQYQKRKTHKTELVAV